MVWEPSEGALLTQIGLLIGQRSWIFFRKRVNTQAETHSALLNDKPLQAFSIGQANDPDMAMDLALLSPADILAYPSRTTRE